MGVRIAKVGMDMYRSALSMLNCCCVSWGLMQERRLQDVNSMPNRLASDVRTARRHGVRNGMHLDHDRMIADYLISIGGLQECM